MRTHYYAPELMRFIQKDQKFSGTLDDPQSLNRYAYVKGDPIRFVDPNGDSWLGNLVAVVTLAIAAVAVLAAVVVTGGMLLAGAGFLVSAGLGLSAATALVAGVSPWLGLALTIGGELPILSTKSIERTTAATNNAPKRIGRPMQTRRRRSSGRWRMCASKSTTPMPPGTAAWPRRTPRSLPTIRPTHPGRVGEEVSHALDPSNRERRRPGPPIQKEPDHVIDIETPHSLASAARPRGHGASRSCSSSWRRPSPLPGPARGATSTTPSAGSYASSCRTAR